MTGLHTEPDPLALLAPGASMASVESARVTAESQMDDQTARRLTLNMTTAGLLAPKLAQGADLEQKDINRAVQLASDIDKAVVKRLRWEARRRPDGSEAPPEV